MSRKREAIFTGVGVLTGLALCGPAAQAASAVTATLSNQPIYVDGQRVAMTAYNIGGNNYVRLRDVGKAVDFGVTYDAASNTVRINSTESCQEQVMQSASSVTEESVQATLAGLQQFYPRGTVFPAPYRSTRNGPYSRGVHCSGWATLCSDVAFGDLPWRRVERPSRDKIRAGDVVEYENAESHHAVVVIQKKEEYIVVTESGLNNKTR